MSATATKQTLVVTKDELLELFEWERKYAEAKKKVAAAEKELSFRRQALAEKVVGVKSTDELKALTPEQIIRISGKRLLAGDWKPERGAPDFAFQQTSAGRYPSWSQLYTDEFGETKAAQIRSQTPVTYSYCVAVSQPSQ